MRPPSETGTRQPLLSFFVLIYLMSAPLWALSFLLHDIRLPLGIPVTDILATFSPFTAACVLTYRRSGGSGVRRLIGRIVDFKKIKPVWWLVIVGLPVSIFALIYIVLRMTGHELPSRITFSAASIIPLALFFYAGGILEEVGYTGYATDPALQRFGMVGAALFIGTPWALWHVPSMLVQGRSGQWIAWGVLGTIAFRFIYLWLYRSTNASVSAVIFMHTFYNLGRTIFPQTVSSSPLVLYPEVHYGVIIFLAILLFVVLIIFQPLGWFDGAGFERPEETPPRTGLESK